MATIYDLKPAFQNLLRPLANGLVRAGVTPNAVTLGALALSFATGAWLYLAPGRAPLLAVPAVLLLRMALNAIDGMMAKEHGLTSRLGLFLNELGDVLSDTFLYLPFARLADADPRLVVAIVLLAAVAETAGIVAVAAGASRRYDGPMGKSDRAFAFGLIALLLGCGVSGEPWLPWALAAILVLLVVTVANRVRRALAEPAT